MTDITEEGRRQLTAALNANALERPEMEAVHGQVWDTDELGRDYEVIGFGAPFVVVRRKSDGVKGSLCFQHHPRLYWGFQEAS